MDYESIVSKIVGKEHSKSWIALQPKVYYKDGKPFGLIASIHENGIKYLSCAVLNPEDSFTIGMIRDIIQHYNNDTICLITDDNKYQDLIRRSLKRYKFEYVVKDGILFSYGGEKWELEQQ